MNWNRTKNLTCCVLASLCLVLSFSAESSADLIRLKRGGEIRGKVLAKSEKYPNRHNIKTVIGATVSVEKDDVEFITLRPISYEEYEIQVRLSNADVESRWALSQWCQKKRMSLQREKHLREIIDLDPDNEQAHRALGHVKREGLWTTHEEQMRLRGYVRYKGRFITPEEKALLENSQQDREKQQKWHAKIHLWANWLTGRYAAQRQQAVEQIRTIRDPHALPALKKFFADQPSRDIRLLYVESLTHIDAPASLTALVTQGLFDIDQGIRTRAIDSIPEEKSNQASGVLIYHLSNSKNIIVRRAATALSKLGGKQAVPHLIDALITTHKYRIEVDAPSVGFTLGSGGNVSQGLNGYRLPPELQAGVLTGQIPRENIHFPNSGSRIKKQQTVRVNQQNPEVLEALKAITKSDFGYDKRTWKLWWLSQNS